MYSRNNVSFVVIVVTILMSAIAHGTIAHAQKKETRPDPAASLVHLIFEKLIHRSGSGVIIARKDNTYTILSNRHVVEHRLSRSITLYKNNKRYIATLVALPCDLNPQSVGDATAQWAEYTRRSMMSHFFPHADGMCQADIALLQLTTPDVLPVTPIRRTPIKEGETICATGWVFSNNKFVKLKSCGPITHVLSQEQYFDAALGIGFGGNLQRGMSGGPIVDASGALVGLVTQRKLFPYEPCPDCALWKTTVTRTPLDPKKIATYSKSNWGVLASVACYLWKNVCETTQASRLHARTIKPKPTTSRRN